MKAIRAIRWLKAMPRWGGVVLALFFAVEDAAAGAIEAEGRDRVCRPNSFAAWSTTVTRWNERALEAICRGRPMPTIVSRELFILHTAIYDAWAAYDDAGLPVYWRAMTRRPVGERTEAARREAIGFAALEVLTEFYPGQIPEFFDQLNREGFFSDRFVDPDEGSPAWVGIQAADAALDHRQADGANATFQYRDISNYQPTNAPDASPDAIDPNRWQPLIVTNFDAALRPADFVLNPPFFDPLAYGHFAPQMFITPHWPWVEPFALAAGDALRPPPPPRYGGDRLHRCAGERDHVASGLYRPIYRGR